MNFLYRNEYQRAVPIFWEIYFLLADLLSSSFETGTCGFFPRFNLETPIIMEANQHIVPTFISRQALERKPKTRARFPLTFPIQKPLRHSTVSGIIYYPRASLLISAF